MFLAFAPPARRDELLGQITYDKYTEYTLTSRQQVERDLLLTQARGYGTALREEFLQITGMAAPVRDEKGDVIAAVSLWSLDRDASPEAVIARAGGFARRGQAHLAADRLGTGRGRGLTQSR